MIHWIVFLYRKILNDSLKRPVSIVGNEMHYITSTIVDRKLLFLILVRMPEYRVD